MNGNKGKLGFDWVICGERGRDSEPRDSVPHVFAQQQDSGFGNQRFEIEEEKCQEFCVSENLAKYAPTDGFFDAGMLLQALKARGEGLDGEAKPSERAGIARRREVGKKLRLSEY